MADYSQHMQKQLINITTKTFLILNSTRHNDTHYVTLGKRIAYY